MATEFLFKQAARLCKVRWAVLLFATLLALLSVSLGASLDLFHIYLRLITLTAVTNIISTLAYEHYKNHASTYTPKKIAVLQWWTYFQTLADLLLLTAGIHYTGGIHSPGIYLLLIYIAGMAITYGTVLPVAIFTAISMVLFTGLFIAYKHHLLTPIGIFSSPADNLPPSASFTVTIIAVDGLLLTMAGITLAQSHRLRKLWEESEAQRAFFASLHQLSRHGLQYHDLYQTVRFLSQRLQTLLNADEVFTILWEERGGQLSPLATYNIHDNLQHRTLSTQERQAFHKNCQRLLQRLESLHPFWIHLNNPHPSLPPALQQRLQEHQSLLLFPIHTPGRQTLIGVVSLAFHQTPSDPTMYTQRAQRALEVIAPLFARTVTLHQISAHLTLLQELANDVTGLTQNLNLHHLAPAITENAARLLNATTAIFIPYTNAPIAQYLKTWHTAGLDPFLAQECYKHQNVCQRLLRDEIFLQLALPEDCALLPPALQEACQAHRFHLLAFFAIPSPRAPLGLLILLWQNKRQLLTPHEIAVGKLFAARAGAALYNAYLYHLLRKEARTDALTGLPNRRAVDEALEQEWKRAQRYHHPFSIVMLDLNHFKRINDQFGHQKGDVALQHAAALLKQNLRETDFVGRYGGDEFLIILPESTREDAHIVMHKVTEAAARAPWDFLAPDFHLTLSYGIATYPDDGTEVYALVDIADRRLYENKPAE